MSSMSIPRWSVFIACALVTLGCYLFQMGVLVPHLAETVPTHVGEVIGRVSSLWPSFIPRDNREEARAITLPFSVMLAVLFGAYGVALWAVAGRSSRLAEFAVFGMGTVYSALLATSPVMLANDVYSYAAYGRMYALNHVDPAVVLTPLPAGDPYTKLWGEFLPPSSYGPAWTLISAGVALLAATKIGLTVLLYRAVAVLAVLVTTILIAICARRFAPERTAQGMLFFMWNPLVILESAMSGHNDAVMICFFLAGIALHLYGRGFLALVLFSLSVLIKFATAPLIPIYVVMVLRQLPNWRARSAFLAQAAAAGALTLAAMVVFAESGSQPRKVELVRKDKAPLLGWWVFQQRYTNSPHELLYRALRICMGEEPDDVRDVEFWGWWIKTLRATALRSTATGDGELVERIKRGTPLLVTQPRSQEIWLRVYNPETGKKGYVLEENTDAIDRPAIAERDPELVRWEMGTSPTAVRADLVLKTASWAAFGLAWLAALAYARDLRRFLLAATSLFLASYWLVSTTFYAWYVIWALALAVLVPMSAPALLTVLLSASSLIIYAATGYDDPRDSMEWVFIYRSVLIFGLPLLLFPAAYGVKRALRIN